MISPVLLENSRLDDPALGLIICLVVFIGFSIFIAVMDRRSKNAK